MKKSNTFIRPFSICALTALMATNTPLISFASPTSWPPPKSYHNNATQDAPSLSMEKDVPLNATYEIVSDWKSGFGGRIKITNESDHPIRGWNASFAFKGNQKITSLWNGIYTQEGEKITISNASWNKTILPQETISVGFNTTYSGINNKDIIVTSTGTGFICPPPRPLPSFPDVVKPDPVLPTTPDTSNPDLASPTTPDTGNPNPTSPTTPDTGNPLPASPTPPDANPSHSAGGLKISATTTAMGNNVNASVTIANPIAQSSYHMDGLPIWGFTFKTNGKVSAIPGVKSFNQEGENVNVFLHAWEAGIELGGTRTISFDLMGKDATISDLKIKYMRGSDIYPQYSQLPKDSLIANKEAYYNQNIKPVTDGLIMYTPSSKTQLLIGQADGINVNNTPDIKILVPNKYAAMGLGAVQEFFSINPNYLAALGTKENFAFGFLNYQVGMMSQPLTVNNKTWYWGMTSDSKDGPFQQETPNFNEMKTFFPDLFQANANHDDYTYVSAKKEDPNFIDAAISSAMSINMTREVMYAVDAYKFKDFIHDSKDPLAESVILTYIYNRGLYSYQPNMFTTDRTTNLASTNLIKTLGFNGFADHVPQVLGIMEEMNNSKDIYDTNLTKDDINTFFHELRKYFMTGMTDTAWATMMVDVESAFDELSQHWGNNTISYRYDFITLMRVAKKHLPTPLPPAPKSQTYIDQISNKNNLW